MAPLSLVTLVSAPGHALEFTIANARQYCDALAILSLNEEPMAPAMAGVQSIALNPEDSDFWACCQTLLERLEGDWILWMQPGEVIAEDAIARLEALKASGVSAEVNIIFLPVQTAASAESATLECRLFRKSFLVGLCQSEMVETQAPEFMQGALTWVDIVIHPSGFSEEAMAREDEDKGGSAFLLLLQARLAEMTGCDAWASTICDTILKRNPGPQSQYQALLCLGRCHARAGEFEQALRACYRAILTDSRKPEAWMQLGLYWYGREEWEKAISAFSVLQRDDPSQYAWRAAYYLSFCLSNTGRYEEAVRTTLKAWPHHPDKARLRDSLHWILAQMEAQEAEAK
jgi:tetratricopeptide (TPR) repeat protein